MHELRSHVQAIELHDLLEVESAPKTELTITGFEVAKGSDNSVLKAQAALEAAAERALPAAFTLHKRWRELRRGGGAEGPGRPIQLEARPAADRQAGRCGRHVLP